MTINSAMDYNGAQINLKGKSKVTPVHIISALCHEKIWGSEGIAPPFLTPAPDGGEWLAFHSG
jgi:hypothetical protein